MYPISCKLDEIAKAMSEPTSADGWMLAVSAASALGTLVIAGFNIWLLFRQHLLLKMQHEAARRGKRAEFAVVLRESTGKMLSLAVSGETWAPEKHLDEMRELARVGELSDEPSFRDLNLFCSTVARHSGIVRGSVDLFLKKQEQLSRVITNWVRDPSSVDLTIPEDVEARLRESLTRAR